MMQKLKQILKPVYLFSRGLVLNTLSVLVATRNTPLRPGGVRNILLIRIDRIGDIVLSTPALKALRKGFPSAHISLLVSPAMTELLSNCPYVDDIIPYNGVSSLGMREFDLAVDLHLDYPLRTAVIAYRSRARYRVGFNIAGKGVFFNVRISPDKKGKHLIDHTLEIVKAIGAEIDDRVPELSISPDAKAYVSSFMSRNHVSDTRLLIGIHPGGYYPSQRWMTERFAATGDKIIEDYAAQIVLIGGPGEETLAEKTASAMRGEPLVWVNESLVNLVALIDKCDLLICNNSGPLHIATAVKTPTVSTLGPTDPVRWWPHGGTSVVVKKRLSCIGCNRGECSHHVCMRQITVDEVMEAVGTVLTRPEIED
jgi:lipopolysaccharide heptosyltransferase II